MAPVTKDSSRSANRHSAPQSIPPFQPQVSYPTFFSTHSWQQEMKKKKKKVEDIQVLGPRSRARWQWFRLASFRPLAFGSTDGYSFQFYTGATFLGGKQICRLSHFLGSTVKTIPFLTSRSGHLDSHTVDVEALVIRVTVYHILFSLWGVTGRAQPNRSFPPGGEHTCSMSFLS